MANKDLKKSRSSNKKKRTLRLDRVLGTVLVATSLTLASGYGIRKLLPKNTEKSNQEIELAIDSLDGKVDDYFDKFTFSKYHIKESFDLYSQSEDEKSMDVIDSIGPEVDVNVYGMFSIQTNDNSYLYCEIPDLQKAGIINSELLTHSRQITTKYADFSEIYLVKEGIMLKSSPSAKGKKITTQDENTVLFAKENNSKTDWLTVRTDDGKIGYVKKSKKIEKINDGKIMEVSERYDGNSFLPQERVLVIGDGKNENWKLAIHCNKSGILVSNQLPELFLEEVDFSKEKNIIEEDPTPWRI